ncbi:unnamed protein product [Discula destructiva]
MVRRDNLLLTGSYDTTIRIWDLATGEQTRLLEGGHSEYVSVLTFSPDGNISSDCVGQKRGSLYMGLEARDSYYEAGPGTGGG